jgi:hypothetical protein
LSQVVRRSFFLASCLSLVPLGVGELSVNYFFVLVPVAWIVSRGRLEPVPDFLKLAAALYLLVFLFAAIMMIGQVDMVVRRLGSFVVFMTLFSFAMVRLDRGYVRAFKLAVVAVSVAYSFQAIVVFLQAAASGPLDFEAKNLVGSQRYGFVYVMGLWILLLERWSGRRAQMARLACIVTILCGLGLTFSRSSFVATAGSVGLFFAAAGIARIARMEFFIPSARGIAGLVVLILAAVGAAWMFPLTVEFYWQTLLMPLADFSLFEAMRDPGSSEGIRVVRVLEAVAYVIQYPLTGTGFLGIWTVSPTGGGSAHNQLLDVFLRVGVVGFAVYLLILAALMRFLSRSHRSLFWGMVGILIYGFFHETFKESQGAFILAFLVGMMAEDWRSRRRSRSGAQEVPHVVPLVVS